MAERAAGGAGGNTQQARDAPNETRGSSTQDAQGDDADTRIRVRGPQGE
eukprot:CAMPEP_0173429456 /NCGR_PEP_ID=MMETSP1357-20121228/8170_1 /TAXON_ID=77926 /ORGANISM="Hemiselmis rufescens, Strain PCC563" /LENGTH=48 /DNA_ID= /DNA_START= /DNA_END= /DNA_ORIENTATION=